MAEKEVERKLVEGVKKLGGIAYKWVSPGNSGVPDRIVILPNGQVIFAELKTDEGRLSEIQRRQMNRLTALRTRVVEIRGESGVKKFLDTCEKELNEWRFPRVVPLD